MMYRVMDAIQVLPGVTYCTSRKPDDILILVCMHVPVFAGQMISFETVAMKYHDADAAYSPRDVHPNRCYWKEYPDTKKRFVLCIRVFAFFGEEVDGYESLGELHRLPVYIGITLPV